MANFVKRFTASYMEPTFVRTGKIHEYNGGEKQVGKRRYGKFGEIYHTTLSGIGLTVLSSNLTVTTVTTIATAAATRDLKTTIANSMYTLLLPVLTNLISGTYETIKYISQQRALKRGEKLENILELPYCGTGSI